MGIFFLDDEIGWVRGGRVVCVEFGWCVEEDDVGVVLFKVVFESSKFDIGRCVEECDGFFLSRYCVVGFV